MKEAMPLSTAIRMGSMLRPQAFEDFFDNGGSCALGAAAEAAGLGALFADSVLIKRWPILGVWRECPVSGQRFSILTIIIDLNDIHEWTREQIADIVEQWEKQGEHPFVETGVEVGVHG